jgi:hypothetical protein
MSRTDESQALADFIARHSKPYDPETDNYDRPPFAADIKEGENDPIYNAHSYHTKVPHKAIMRYILHYTKPGDIVFDGFCGTGMTGVAAQMCGAPDAGFRVHVVDDREKFANAERFPEAAEVVVDSIPEWLHRTELPQSAYVVVVTRGHTHDLDAMRALAARDLKYLGLIGSRAKVRRIFDLLLEEGMPQECLARVRAPIGLDIGAVTPVEIAISIMAELVAVRRGVDTASLAMKRLDVAGSK